MNPFGEEEEGGAEEEEKSDDDDPTKDAMIKVGENIMLTTY